VDQGSVAAALSRAHCFAEPLETMVLDAIRANPPKAKTDEQLRRAYLHVSAAKAIEEHLVSCAAGSL